MAEKGAQTRKRMDLTIEKKLEILEQAKDKSASSLARKYNIGISTVCDIKKNEEKLKAFIQALLGEFRLTQKKKKRGK